MTTVVDDALGAGRIAIAREIAGTHHVDLEKAPRRIFFTHLAHLIGQIAARHGLGRPDGCESSRPDGALLATRQLSRPRALVNARQHAERAWRRGPRHRIGRPIAAQHAPHAVPQLVDR